MSAREDAQYSGISFFSFPALSLTIQCLTCQHPDRGDLEGREEKKKRREWENRKSGKRKEVQKGMLRA